MPSHPGQSTPPDKTLRAALLEGLLPGLIHGFSTNLPFADLPSFGEALGGLLRAAAPHNGARPILLEQPHSANILVASGAAERRIPQGQASKIAKGVYRGFDGAVGSLAEPAILSIRAADCVPVLAVDVEIGAYGALHAGWRGVAAGILPNLLQGWRRAGSSLAAVRLAFGPAIRACCFEVRQDCISAFHPAHLESAIQTRGGATHLDLVAVLRTQARTFGVEEARMEVLPYCTTCHGKGDGSYPFASYRRSRREGLPISGRNAAFVGIAAERTEG